MVACDMKTHNNEAAVETLKATRVATILVGKATGLAGTQHFFMGVNGCGVVIRNIIVLLGVSLRHLGGQGVVLHNEVMNEQ